MKNIRLGKFLLDNHGTLHGKIFALGLGAISVISEPAVSNAGQTYHKLIADPMREAFEVGMAFPKEKDGVAYFSVSLESPLFPAGINGVLFPDKENNQTFNLLWSRSDISRHNLDADGQQPRRYLGSGAAAATP